MSVAPIISGPEADLCLVHHLQKRLHAVGSSLTSIMEDIFCCKGENHTLVGCTAFWGLSLQQKIDIVRENPICLNCLRPGYLAKNCCSVQRCRKCKQPHHTWLHGQKEDEGQTKAADSSKEHTDVSVTHVSCLSGQHQLLLMTCQLQVIGPDGSTCKARGFAGFSISGFIHYGACGITFLPSMPS